MGTEGIMPAFLLAFAWTVLTATPSVATKHYCLNKPSVQPRPVEREQAPCSQFMDEAVKGYILDTLYPMELNGTCTFKKLKEEPKNVKTCCEGWGPRYPNCDTPICKGGCKFGKCTENDQPGELPKCTCDPGYIGDNCDESLQELTSALQYCYQNRGCKGPRRMDGGVVFHSDCCTDGTGSWGSAKGCQKCRSRPGTNDTVLEELDRRTCMFAGDSVFRSFDDARFNRFSTCTVVLVKSTTGLQVQARTICEAKNKCNCDKVVTVKYVEKNKELSLEVADGKVTVSGPKGSIVVPITSKRHTIGSSVVVRMEDDSYYVKFPNLGFDFRLDVSGLLVLTILKDSPLVNTLSGLCGNFDGSSMNDQANLDKLFEEFTDTKAPCGAGFKQCPKNMMDEALSACDSLRSDSMFGSCLERGVEPQAFFDLCLRGYCTSKIEGGPDKADLARCNVFDMFAQTCYKEARTTINWRTNTFCPKTCPNGKEYHASVHTNCPITCGKSPISYFDKTCKPDGHPGCECPLHKVRLNDTCVDPDDCQCIGDDRRFYNRDTVIQSSDKCMRCTCKSLGLWDCKKSTAQCMGFCSIIGNAIHSFDGMVYAVEVSSCALTLMQDRSGENKLELRTGDCKEGQGPCVHGIQLTHEGKVVLKMALSDEGFENQAASNTDKRIRLRRVSNNYRVLDAPSGLRIYLSNEGMVHIEAPTAIFKDKVYGLCGTLNGDVRDELMSPQGGDVADKEFLSVYSDCTNPVKKSLESFSDPLCDSLASANMPPTGHVNMDTFHKLCSSKKTEQGRCQVIQSLALSLKTSVAKLLGSNHPCVEQTCTATAHKVCDSNCKDISNPLCREDTIFDCGCGDGMYFKGENCVDKRECGCYNMNTTRFIDVGQTEEIGCMACECTGFELECKPSCEEVICAKGQASWAQVKAEQKDRGNCTRMMCPEQYKSGIRCAVDENPFQSCYCQKGLMQTQEYECVEYCPCYEDGWRKHGESITRHCKTKVCNNGIWEISNTDRCVGTCTLSGSPMKLKRFDDDALTETGINANCEYKVFVGGDYTVKVKGMHCGSGAEGCFYKVTLEVKYLTRGDIEIFRGMDGFVVYNGQAYRSGVNKRITVVSLGLYTEITMDNALTIRYGNEGMIAQIIVKHEAFNEVKGLCGNFDRISTNDYTGPDNNLVMSLEEAAKGWGDMDECISQPPEPNMCEMSPTKKEWAQGPRACGAIHGEDFEACRKKAGTDVVKSYFDNCVNSACTCDNAGDCECMCSAVAAFALLCSENGFPARYRHQTMCPVQCDYKSDYEACGSPCPAVCGAEPTECSGKPCVEGCFCPPGYLRASFKSLECVPQSECPCTINGNSVQPGKSLTVNCQQCRCENGTMTCEGETCKRGCAEDEIQCRSGHCLPATARCNGMPDCPSGSDEENCLSVNCTGHTCDEGTKCLDESETCDGIVHCLDGTDETVCATRCKPDEFKCKEFDLCKPKSWMCDQHKDCSNGFDELDCKVCPENFTHCNQSFCTPMDKICDGHQDCHDASDEIGCTTPETTKPPDCKEEEVTLSPNSADVTVSVSSGTQGDAFSSKGWTADKSDTDPTIRLTVTPNDSATPVLMEVTMKVRRGTVIEFVLYDESGDITHLEKVTSPTSYLSKEFNHKFVSLDIKTDGTVSRLRAKACFKPTEVFTTETTEITSTEEITTTMTETTTAATPETTTRKPFYSV